MKQSKRKLAILAGGVCMFVMAMVVVPSTAKAANTGVKWVDEDKEYTDYDLNGDGKSDDFYYETSYSDENSGDAIGTINVYVNDKKVFSQEREYSPNYGVQLITLENGKTFVDIESSILSEDDVIHKLYQCKSGKLRSVYDYQKIWENYSDYYLTDIKKVSGNSLQLSCYSQFYTTGRVRWNMKVNYTNGKFKRAGSSYTIDYKAMGQKNIWTAQRIMKAYNTAGGKKVAYKINKGNKIKIYTVVIKNDKVYFKVKNKSGKGKTAYLPCVKKLVYNPFYFKECVFAG